MESSIIGPSWPNALRWFLAQNLHSFTPWHFIQSPSELTSAANAFRREGIGGREVFVFAYRQDCDDFAGLEVINGKITDKVIHFHPVFSSTTNPSAGKRDWNIVVGVFDDVFEFTSQCVIRDMKDWADTEDASDL